MLSHGGRVGCMVWIMTGGGAGALWGKVEG